MKLNLDRIVFSTIITCLIFCTITLFYKLNIHSDVLFMEYLFRDILKGSGEWQLWKLAPAPSFFPDMLLYLVAYHILPTVPLRIFFVTVSQIFIIGLLTYWLAGLLNPQASHLKKSLPLLFLTIAVVAANHTATPMGIGIFFNANNIQVPSLISSLALLGLYMKFIEKPNLLIGMSILILTSLAYASSAVFILSFTAPFFSTLILLIIISKKRFLNQLHSTCAMGTFISAHVCGYFLSKVLTYNTPLEGRIRINYDSIQSSWHNLILATSNLSSLENAWSSIAFWIFLLTFFYAFSFAIRMVWTTINTRELIYEHINSNLLISSVYLVFCTVLSILGSVLSGGFADPYGYRYFMTFISLSSIIASVLLGQRTVLKKQFYSKSYVYVLLVTIYCLSSIANVTIAEDRRNNQDIYKYGAVIRHESKVAECINDVIRSGIHLYSGVADFWNSRGVSFYLEDKISITATQSTFDPLFWISSVRPIINPSKYGIEKYNFTIAHGPSEYNPIKFDIEILKPYLPTGYKVFNCKRIPDKIIYYVDNTFDTYIRNKFQQYSFSYGGESALWSGVHLPGKTGIISGQSRIASKNDRAGFLIFGPYLNLKGGHYVIDLDISFDSNTPDDQILGKIEIGSFDSLDRKPLISEDILKRNHKPKMKFTVPDSGITNFEVRLFFNGNATLQFNHYTLTRDH